MKQIILSKYVSKMFEFCLNSLRQAQEAIYRQSVAELVGATLAFNQITVDLSKTILPLSLTKEGAGGGL